jgi:tetratricopeptide (TPR) repeat protein
MQSFKLILILLLVLAVNTCSQAQQMPKDVYKRSAKIELQRKNPDYERVINLLEEAKTYYPDDGEIFFLLGQVYKTKNQPRKMFEAFNQALKLSLKDKYVKEIKEMIKESWATTFNRGVDYANKVDKVERYAEQSFSDWSNYPLYIDSLQMLSSEFNDTTYNWINYSSAAKLAIPLEKLKQDLYKKSLEFYELSMLLDSTHYESYVNGAFVCSKLGESEKALEYFEKAYELKPDDVNVLNSYFAVLLNNKRYEEALAISQEILKNDPEDLNVLFNQAVILEGLERKKEALELYNRILELDPNSKDVLFNRALLYLNETNNIAKQLIALRDSIENNPKAQGLIDRSNKLIEEQKGFFGKAESDFRKVLDIDPGDSETMRFLGYCYLNQEKTDQAIEVLEKLTQNEPDNKEAWGYLSIAYAKKGLAQKAKEAEQKAQE